MAKHTSHVTNIIKFDNMQISTYISCNNGIMCNFNLH